MKLTLSIICCAAFLAASPVRAADEKIYDGMTPQELAAFAEAEGWTADDPIGASLLVRLGDSSVLIEMYDCDADLRCAAGVMRDISYYVVDPKDENLWHWNQTNKGATGYGPSYVTLQRHLHFRGVTDSYLRGVMGEVWPRAAEEFWEEVRRIYPFRPGAGEPADRE